MDKLAKTKKNPSKVLAIDIIALNPSFTNKQVADKVGVSEFAVRGWKQDPNFIDACYDRYMVEFGSQLPSVLNAMLREAQAGNVQAGRLVLEHSGKLVKNINITVDSPFEKFLKSVPDAEVVDDTEIVEAAESVEVDFSELPPRNEENQDVRAKKEKYKTREAILKEEKRVKRNKQQKEWYKWRKRAKAVGVEALKERRPTPAQRKEWESKIIEAENK
jgi:hypothetical protein